MNTNPPANAPKSSGKTSQKSEAYYNSKSRATSQQAQNSTSALWVWQSGVQRPLSSSVYACVI